MAPVSSLFLPLPSTRTDVLVTVGDSLPLVVHRNLLGYFWDGPVSPPGLEEHGRAAIEIITATVLGRDGTADVGSATATGPLHPSRCVSFSPFLFATQSLSLVPSCVPLYISLSPLLLFNTHRTGREAEEKEEAGTRRRRH